MTSLIFMLGIVVLFYFVLIRPRQRQQRQTQDMLANLQVGDEIVTTSGIYGQIEEFDEGTLFLRVADEAVIKVARQAIAQKIEYREDWEDEDDHEAMDDAVEAHDREDDPKAISDGSDESD